MKGSFCVLEGAAYFISTVVMDTMTAETSVMRGGVSSVLFYVAFG